MDDTRLPFGKYSAVPLPDVPGDYLTWLIRTTKLSSGLRAAVVAELVRRGVTPPAARPTRKVECPDCGEAPLDCTWLEASNGRRMVRVKCDVCDKNLGFAPLVEPYLGMADQVASQTALLDVLVAVEDQGVQLRNDGKAVDFASSDDWRAATPELRQRLREVRHTLAVMLPRTAGQGRRGTDQVSDRPRFAFVVEALPDDSRAPAIRLRWLLKIALRSFRLRCVEAKEVRPEPAAAAADERERVAR